jgi:hypothetical protein
VVVSSSGCVSGETPRPLGRAVAALLRGKLPGASVFGEVLMCFVSRSWLVRQCEVWYVHGSRGSSWARLSANILWWFLDVCTRGGAARRRRGAPRLSEGIGFPCGSFHIMSGFKTRVFFLVCGRPPRSLVWRHVSATPVHHVLEAGGFLRMASSWRDLEDRR